VKTRVRAADLHVSLREGVDQGMIEVHAVVMDLLAGTQVAGAGGVAF
jgi:hypothetical protein